MTGHTWAAYSSNLGAGVRLSLLRGIKDVLPLRRSLSALRARRWDARSIFYNRRSIILPGIARTGATLLPLMRV